MEKKEEVITLIMIPKISQLKGIPQVIGIYGNEESFEEEAKSYLELLYLYDCRKDALDVFVGNIINKLNTNNVAEDTDVIFYKRKNDGVMYSNFEGKIINILKYRGINEIFCPKGTYLPDMSGEAEIILCHKVKMTTDPDTNKSTILLTCKDEDAFWTMNDLTFDKQRKLYNDIKDFFKRIK